MKRDNNGSITPGKKAPNHLSKILNQNTDSHKKQPHSLSKKRGSEIHAIISNAKKLE